MKPIINPLWIYLIDVLGNADMVSTIIFLIAIVVFILIVIPYVIAIATEEVDEEESKLITNLLKRCAFIGTLFLVVTIAIPSKSTMYTMMTLEQVTPDNIKVVGEAGENIIDYITEKIDEVVNDKDLDEKGE